MRGEIGLKKTQPWRIMGRELTGSAVPIKDNPRNSKRRDYQMFEAIGCGVLTGARGINATEKTWELGSGWGRSEKD